MSETKLNISRQTNALLRRLGLEPTMVKQLIVTPTTVDAIVFLPNENGNKCVVDGAIVTDTLHFDVRT